MTTPTHSDEAERLRALYDLDILDTPPEESFDRIARLAVQLFDVPMAAVSLIDANRQWFKACFGVEDRETPRELSFCTHTILSNDVMVVPDAHADPEFMNHPLVTGQPGIRFYAGAPLTAAGGQNIGALCVMDTVARDFTPTQQEQLASLTAIVVSELRLRRTARSLQQSEADMRSILQENIQLSAAIAHTTTGIVVTDPRLPDNPTVFANPAFYAMTGYPSEEVLNRNCRFLQGPDTDRNVVGQIAEAVNEHRPYITVLANYRKDGRRFMNELRINPVLDAEGRLTAYVGIQTDVTEREDAREMLEERVRERTADLEQSQSEILARLARAAEFRDDDTGRHTQRVGSTARLIALAAGFPAEAADLIGQTAPLHDVGKIAISDVLLLKPGKLSFEEFTAMQTHTTVGAALLSEGHSELVRMANRIAGAHHERWDGSGYPNGTAGEQIPIEARIVAIADVFDALTHVRPYKPAWPIEEAVAEIARQRARQFDPTLVDAFLGLNHADLV